MGFTPRRDFTLGWSPDVDPIGGPPNAVLRGDNLVLDERDVLSLRRGSAKVNASPLADLDVHSLFTTMIDGARYRMAAANANVYANGSPIAGPFTGSGDIPFSFQLGQILFARGTTKKKYDGTTVRNWGIAMTGGKPTAVALPADGKTFASCAASESPAFTQVEGAGGMIYAPNHYATTDPLYSTVGAIQTSANTSTARAVYQKTFAAPTDFTTYDGGEKGTDDDIITWFLRVPEPKNLLEFAIQIDVNDGRFVSDFYTSPILDGRLPATTLDSSFGASLPVVPPAGVRTRPPGVPAVGTAVQRESGLPGFRVGLPSGGTGADGFFKVSFRRGDFIRIGTTNGKDWSTVKAIRIFVLGQINSTIWAPSAVTYVDTIRISGGKQRPLLGTVAWRYCYVYNTGKYIAKSPLSPASDPAVFSAEAAAVTAPADASRDSQVNEIWFFRQDQLMQGFYRSVVKTGVSGTGSQSANDTLHRDEVLTIDIPAETDTVVPPDNIIGLVGPHFDRTLALTSDGMLWPSRKLDPDAFATSQAIRVGGSDETPYWIFRALQDVFVGTSKDIYRLEGTGAEEPDGSIDYTLQPLSMDHRPINPGVTHEGNQIAFFSDDGWRAMEGLGSKLLTGRTSLLYRGQARHGVGPVDLAGRVRGALAKGQLVAITPELTGTRCVIYRYVFARDIWYRHTYGTANWLSVHREPDGTLIAGDDAGTVWELDTGTQDDGNTIAVTLWTKADDLEHPYQRKKIGDLMVRAETGGATATIGVHLDANSLPYTLLSLAQSGPGVTPFDLGNPGSLHEVAACRQVQLRLTGRFPAFHFYDVGWQFRERPVPMIGRVVDTRAGSPGVKVISGLLVRGNTFGATRTFTAFLDGVPDPETLAMTTGLEEPQTVTLRFLRTARRGVDIGWAVDGELELDDWSPIVTHRQPVGVHVWDSGPIDLGDKELVWLREMYLKVRAGADLIITPYFDGVEFPTVTASVTTPDVDTIVRVPVGRAYVGRQPRLVVTSCAPFYPYFVRCVRRTTGSASQKPMVTVPFKLESGGAG